MSAGASLSRVVDHEAWWAFVAKLARERWVYAPLSDRGNVLYRRMQPGDTVRWDCLPTTLSARSVLLPQRETLFRYRTGDAQVALEVPRGGPGPIMLGLPPCDLRALQVLDRIFITSENPDVYYVARRRQMLVVGVACLAPRATCFCTRVGGDPFAREGADLFVTDLGDVYLVEALTPAGQAPLAGVPWPAAGEAERARAEALAARARKSLPAPSDPPALTDLSPELLEAPLWDALAQRCLGCGACSFACPTCHCFDIVDERLCVDCGERVRNWDTCQFAVYSLEASGYNPRANRRLRIRQRMLDKLAYVPQRTGLPGCVGCGRCIRICPVNVDVREVIDEVCHV